MNPRVSYKHIDVNSGFVLEVVTCINADEAPVLAGDDGGLCVLIISVLPPLETAQRPTVAKRVVELA